jgi:hypothetical protein
MATFDGQWMVPRGSGARTAYFRHPVTLRAGSDLCAAVAAAGRYVLYLDGERVARRTRAATVRLRADAGDHVLGVVVTDLRDGPRFAARVQRDGKPVAGEWRAVRDRAYRFPDATTGPVVDGIAFPRETLDGRAYPIGWWGPGLDGDWPAVDRDGRVGEVAHSTSPRGVTDGTFVEADGDGRELVDGDGRIGVPPGETTTFTVRAGERVVGFPVVTVDADAAGATVEIDYRPDGAGGDRFVSPAGEHTYLPLDPRPFEAVEIEVTAGDAPVAVTGLGYRALVDGPSEPARDTGLVRFDRVP